MPRNTDALHSHVTACVFAALIAAGSILSIPLPGTAIPIVLQNMLAVLAGLILGPVLGLEAVLVFFAIGALGAPVFAGGKGGLAHFAGSTGGYLVGYAAAAFLAGLISRASKAPKGGLLLHLLASLSAFLVIDAFGVARLSMLIGFPKAVVAGVLPYIIGDAVKLVAAALISFRLAPFADELLDRGRTSVDQTAR